MPKESKRLILEQITPEHRAALEPQKDEVRPSRRQYHHWSSWIKWSLEPDPAGWWYGWCPLADPQRTTSMSAQFSFWAGSMRCTHDEPCHTGKRAISLYNVEQRLSNATTV